jgi:hypothetical protein
MYIEIDSNNKVLGYSDKPSGNSIETNEELPTYTDVQILKFVNGKFVVEDSQELANEKADWIANQYQRDRALQYPSIQDVVVALAEKEEGDDTMWQEITALRQKVKSDNPKPT